jgi:prefoldin subunit 5
MAELGALRTAIDGLATKIGELRDVITAIKAGEGPVQSTIDDLTARITELGDEIDAIKADAEGDTGTDVPAEGETPPTTQSFTKKA